MRIWSDFLRVHRLWLARGNAIQSLFLASCILRWCYSDVLAHINLTVMHRGALASFSADCYYERAIAAAMKLQVLSFCLRILSLGPQVFFNLQLFRRALHSTAYPNYQADALFHFTCSFPIKVGKSDEENTCSLECSVVKDIPLCAFFP